MNEQKNSPRRFRIFRYADWDIKQTFLLFLVTPGNNIDGPKTVTFQFFVGPFFIISQRVFALFQELTVLRWLGPVLGVMCSSHILRPPCTRNGANHMRRRALDHLHPALHRNFSTNLLLKNTFSVFFLKSL